MTLYSYTTSFDAKEHSHQITCLAISLRGDYLASGDEAGKVVVWDIGTSDQEVVFKGGGQAVSSLLWAPSGFRKLLIGRSHGVGDIITDVLKADSVRSIKTGTIGPITCMDIDKHTGLMVLDTGAEVHIASDMGNGNYLTSKVLPRPAMPRDRLEDLDDRVRPLSAHFLSGGKRVVVGYLNHGAICWDLDQEIVVWQIAPASLIAGHIDCTSVSNETKKLLITMLDGTMEVYRFGDTRQPVQVKAEADASHEYILQSVFLNRGKLVASGSEVGVIRVWDPLSGDLVQEVPHRGGRLVRVIAAGRNRSYSFLASASSDGASPRMHLFAMSRNPHFYTSHLEAISDFYVFYLQDAAQTIFTSILARAYIIWVLFILLASILTSFYPPAWAKMEPLLQTGTLYIQGLVSTVQTGLVVRSTDLRNNTIITLRAKLIQLGEWIVASAQRWL